MPSVQVYATVAELRSRIERTRATDDVILLAILTGASRSIDNACNRRLDGFVAAVSSARTYTGSGQAVQRIDECASVSVVAVKDSRGATTYTAWAATDWALFAGDARWPEFNVGPFNKLMVDWNGDYSNFTSGSASGPGNNAFFLSTARGVGLYNPRTAYGVPTVQATALWGYALLCPLEIREATCMQAARWYKRYQGSMSDSLADGELGVLLYRKSLDPDIKRILVDGRYVRKLVS
jgi:hypothetical protein